MREAGYQEHGWQMTAIERYLDGGGALCEGLEYVTLLREPTSRVISHLNDFFNLGSEPWNQPGSEAAEGGAAASLERSAGDARSTSNATSEQLAGEGLPRLPKAALRVDSFFSILSKSNCTADGLRHRLIDWEYVQRERVELPPFFYSSPVWGALCGVVQNYQSRTLLGRRMGADPFATQCHGEGPTCGRGFNVHKAAIKELLGFKLVLTLDDAADAAPLMRQSLHWAHTALPYENPAEGRAYFKYDELSQAERKLLDDMNGADISLYKAAREMLRLDLAEVSEDFFVDDED